MKKLILIFAVILTACNQKQREDFWQPTTEKNNASDSQSLVIHQKSTALRYFLIGYSAMHNNDIMSGSFSTCDTALQSGDSLIYLVYDGMRCSHPKFKMSDYAIIGIYEFKNAAEYNKFLNGRNEPLKTSCK